MVGCGVVLAGGKEGGGWRMEVERRWMHLQMSELVGAAAAYLLRGRRGSRGRCCRMCSHMHV